MFHVGLEASSSTKEVLCQWLCVAQTLGETERVKSKKPNKVCFLQDKVVQVRELQGLDKVLVGISARNKDLDSASKIHHNLSKPTIVYGV